MLYRIISALLFAAMLAGGAAFAADANQIDVALHAFQVVPADGGRLVPATTARPGDVIEYQITYHNGGRDTARQVAATLPVPPGGLAYLDGSASPGPFQASVDGTHYTTPPLKRDVVRDGRRIVETIPPSEYRFLRWNLGDLGAGQSARVSARMRLAANEAP